MKLRETSARNVDSLRARAPKPNQTKPNQTKARQGKARQCYAIELSKRRLMTEASASAVLTVFSR